ncbi:sugar phosphate isomerase/epimerase [Tropicimonas sp. IMCC34043]|uniref:sugar phosphate isomerase/epimerase family protein n=1 Tax=Tropicimonas sp. IMCC34043 TaxID=2248760 RepID=UPI000E23DB1B|nr:sugar phosphate isomerase/epimerase family protein [Tropicimonas sp. IMCC34043]
MMAGQAESRIVSVSHLTALEASPEDFIDHAAAAGFNAVGLRINPPAHTADRWPVAGDPGRARALRTRADDAGIRIFEVETFSIWPDFDIEKLLPGLEAGAVMGASMMVCAGIDDDEPRMIDSFGQLADRAAGFGLSVGIEFMPFRPMATLASARRVWTAVARPNARILIDALHLFRSGGSIAEVAALDPASVGYLHLCDAPLQSPSAGGFAEEARGHRLYPGEGGLPLVELLSALPPELPVSVEAPTRNHAHAPMAEQIRRAGAVTMELLAGLSTKQSAETA